MAPPLRYRAPATALLVLGIGILGFISLQVYDSSQPEYDHGVREIEADRVPDGEDVRTLGSFSEPAQEAFLAAVNAAGSHETRTPAPDLTYPGDVVSDENTYILRYDGSLYRMTTLGEGPGAGIAVAFFLTFGLPIALFVIGAGAYGLRAERPTYTVGLLAGLLAAIVFYVFPESTRTGDLTPLWVALGLAIVPWPVLEYLERRTEQ